MLGDFVVKGKWVLVETEFLEPVVISGEDKYLIYKDLDFYSNVHYLYFTRNTEQQSSPIIKRDTVLRDKDIKYNGGGLRVKKNFEKVFEKKRLYWFFFCSLKNTEVILSSKEDLL